MKLFFDVIFALLPLALIVVPTTALIVLGAVLSTEKESTKHRTQPTEDACHDD